MGTKLPLMLFKWRMLPTELYKEKGTLWKSRQLLYNLKLLEKL